LSVICGMHFVIVPKMFIMNPTLNSPKLSVCVWIAKFKMYLVGGNVNKPIDIKTTMMQYLIEAS